MPCLPWVQQTVWTTRQLASRTGSTVPEYFVWSLSVKTGLLLETRTLGVVHCEGSIKLLAAAAPKSLQSCLTLCDPIDWSPPGSPVPGILQARTLEWVAISFSNACMHAKWLQLCLTLCDLMDSSPPGSFVHRILQARILEWVAISFSIKLLEAWFIWKSWF